MRRLILGFFILMSGCSFMANAGEEKEKEPVKKENYEKYEADIETKVEKFDKLSIVMHYPETPNDQIDQTVLDYVNEQRSDFKKDSYERVKKKGISAVQELHVDYDIVYEDSATYVVKFNETVTWGEKRKAFDETVLHFEKSNGKKLSLTHFLRSENDYEEIRDHLERTFERKLSEKELNSFTYEGDAFTFFAGNQSVRVNKQEHPEWFKEKFMKKRSDMTERPGIFHTEKEITEIPVTEKMLEEYPVAVMGGPHPKRTEEILRVLEKNDRKAVFFLIGKRVERYPAAVEAIKEQGHAVVAHTWNQRLPGRLSDKKESEYRERSVNLLSSITGQQEVLVSGDRVSPEKALINRPNWAGKSEAWVTEQLVNSARSNGQLVMSGLNEKTPALLREVLPELKDSRSREKETGREKSGAERLAGM